MNIKSFVNQTREIKDLKELPNTFWNRRKVRKAEKVLDKMIKEVALNEANKMYEQVYNFYYDLIEKNLV